MTYRQPAPDESAIARAVEEVREIDRHLGLWRSLRLQRVTIGFQAATVVFLLVLGVIDTQRVAGRAAWHFTNAIAVAFAAFAQRGAWAQLNRQRRAVIDRAGLPERACILTLTAAASVNRPLDEHDICPNCGYCHNCARKDG